MPCAGCSRRGFRSKARPTTGFSEARYLRDPDRNGVESYRDRPREEWPRLTDGDVALFTHPLDIAALLAEAGETAGETARRTLTSSLSDGRK